MKYITYLFISIVFTACVSTQSTLKNVDKTAVRPLIKDKMYVITAHATDAKYAYDQDYPVNIGNIRENQEDINVAYYFNGLEGLNGEKISYKKINTCCPFPSTNTTMGAGTIGIYEITFEGSDKKLTLYINIYEKGKILCPKGFSIKKSPEVNK